MHWRACRREEIDAQFLDGDGGGVNGTSGNETLGNETLGNSPPPPPPRSPEGIVSLKEVAAKLAEAVASQALRNETGYVRTSSPASDLAIPAHFTPLPKRKPNDNPCPLHPTRSPNKNPKL